VTTKGDNRGAQGATTLKWPWNRPSTTVTTRAGLPPPNHHPESGSIMSQPNAVVLSERAAAILQGFPEDWLFAGKTKKARWSQIGQAMPPPLAHAVATSIARWLRGDHARIVKEA
jgi:DNA (cytosine-5)-methyltransferase 1